MLFQLSNILINRAPFRGRHLRPLRTYRVIPIDRQLGLIEWCSNTMSLNDYLIGPMRSGGAHSKFRPDDTHVQAAFRKLSNRNEGLPNVYDAFMQCCNEVSPVFRFFFYENYPQPHQFHKRIRFYTDSLALWSIGELFVVV